MISVSISINGNCIMARSAWRVEEPDGVGKATYRLDNGTTIRHTPEDGAKELAKKMLDSIKEV